MQKDTVTSTNNINILGIETSCDETAVAIYNNHQGILSHEVYSQIKLHNKYGGVVPELASRDHIRKIAPLVLTALAKAQISKYDLTAIAYTKGPGLIGSLLVGSQFAHGLAYGLNIPIMGVHHMEAHLLAPMLEENKPQLPFVALLISGGHTLLVKVSKLGCYEILGESLDDAAGEAFDKTAKAMGLNYPGGPEIAKLAQLGDPNKFSFSRPMIHSKTCDFSFSGLKTQVINIINNLNNISIKNKQDIAASFQQAVVDILIKKTFLALEKTKYNSLVIAGGVSANTEIRRQFDKIAQKNNIKIYYPRHEYCTDNGAMVAYTGYVKFMQQEGIMPVDIESTAVRARWELSDLKEAKD